MKKRALIALLTTTALLTAVLPLTVHGNCEECYKVNVPWEPEPVPDCFDFTPGGFDLCEPMETTCYMLQLCTDYWPM